MGTFAPMMCFKTSQTMLALAAINSWDMWQMDIKGSVATAQLMFLSENGHCVPNKIPKFLRIFKSVEGAKSQGTCFSTKELDHPFLGYSDSFDLAHGLAPNHSHLNNQERMIQFLSAETCPSALAPSTPWNIFRIMAILSGTQCSFSEKTLAEPWQH